MQLRILTLNVWGVHYIAKLIRPRLEALVAHLTSEEANYDIIGLQEVSVVEGRFDRAISPCSRSGVKLTISTSEITSKRSIRTAITS